MGGLRKKELHYALNPIGIPSENIRVFEHPRLQVILLNLVAREIRYIFFEDLIILELFLGWT